MKLICSQAELNSALQLVSRAVATRPTHPVLANVLLTADSGTGRLSLTGFDLNLGIQTSFSASIEESGALTLPARLLGEIVSKLSSDSPITLISDQDHEQIELRSKNGNYQMRGMSADEFPELPLVESGVSFKLKPKALVEALHATLFASSSDEAKQLLTGVHLSFYGEGIKAAATDGHRLSVVKNENALNDSFQKDESHVSFEDEPTFSVTLPAKSLREVERLIASWNDDEAITLFCDKGQVILLASDQVLTSRTLEGTYPNYSQLIPDTFSKIIDLDKRYFISSLERIAVLADQHNNVIKLSLEEGSEFLSLTADAQDVGSGSERIPVNYSGESVQIAFNVRYLLDGLKVIDSESISLQFNSPTTPAVFSGSDDKESFIYLVMPIQIRSEN